MPARAWSLGRSPKRRWLSGNRGARFTRALRFGVATAPASRGRAFCEGVNRFGANSGMDEFVDDSCRKYGAESRAGLAP